MSRLNAAETIIVRMLAGKIANGYKLSTDYPADGYGMCYVATSTDCYGHYLSEDGSMVTSLTKAMFMLPNRNYYGEIMEGMVEKIKQPEIVLEAWHPSEYETWKALRWKLKQQSKEMFGIKASAPAYIVADRYDDEDMVEEAQILRMKATRYYASSKQDASQGDEEQEPVVTF